MTNEAFARLVEEIRAYLENLAITNPGAIAACRSGEDFEVCVRDATAAVLDRNGIRAEIQYEQGSHTFPDIVLVFDNGDKYGIEVKSSTGTGRSWKINGNSVLGSTKEAVIDTYVVFGKTTLGHQAFRCKRYEDCVVDVAVTHSPRYRIDMDLAPGTTFFDKSGLSYQRISSADKPIELLDPKASTLGGLQKVLRQRYGCSPTFLLRKRRLYWDTALFTFRRYFLPAQQNSLAAQCGWRLNTVSFRPL